MDAWNEKIILSVIFYAKIYSIMLYNKYVSRLLQEITHSLSPVRGESR